ncbi:MAG: M24 family metallopeptidase [Streptosporangiaceae bacterium]
MQTDIAPRVLSPHVAADFAAQEFQARIQDTRAGMREAGLDALLLVSPENIYYLLGLNHQGYFAFTLLVLPIEGPPLLVTRAMEHITVTMQAPGCVHVPFNEGGDPAAAAIDAIGQVTESGQMVGVEEATMFFPVAVWMRIREALWDRLWTDGTGVVERVRSVKSPAEIAFIRRAATISDRAIRAGIDAAGDAGTERAVAAAIYHEMILAGSEHPGFAPFIRSTDILGQEHVTWRDRELRSGTGVLMELSASVYRYHAPLSRMICVGEASPGVHDAAEIALAGLGAVRDALVPGAIAGDVYAAWQKTVDQGLGHEGYRRHHCGYMVGIGFPPSWVGGSAVIGLRSESELVIREGMVFHVLSWLLGQEPGDYCVSDTALVTADGCELLTTIQREPIVLG